MEQTISAGVTWWNYLLILIMCSPAHTLKYLQIQDWLLVPCYISTRVSVDVIFFPGGE